MDFNGFTTRNADRILAATGLVEAGHGQESPDARPPGTPIIQLVEITSTLNETTGLYEGTSVTYTHTGSTATQNELKECRVYYPHERIRFKIGNVLLCRFSGSDEPGTFGVFVPCHKYKITEVVTDVNCVEGEIVCDYEEIVVFDFDIEPEEE